jgi:hypothetical protein
MKRYIKLYESWIHTEKYELASKFRRKVDSKIKITVSHGKIEEIENEANYPFPFFKGQPFQKAFVRGWACKNGFYLNGEEPCHVPEKKIFGVKTKDVPHGHEWRSIFPGKFRD